MPVPFEVSKSRFAESTACSDAPEDRKGELAYIVPCLVVSSIYFGLNSIDSRATKILVTTASVS